MKAAMYRMKHPSPCWQVVYRDPTRREGKRSARVRRHFKVKSEAEAWLAAAGNPEAVLPLHTRARRTIATLAGVPWRQDITRHTYISHRLALVKNEAEVAREAGTSQDMIHRHYHSLKLEREAQAWAGIRPKVLG